MIMPPLPPKKSHIFSQYLLFFHQSVLIIGVCVGNKKNELIKIITENNNVKDNKEISTFGFTI